MTQTARLLQFLNADAGAEVRERREYPMADSNHTVEQIQDALAALTQAVDTDDAGRATERAYVLEGVRENVHAISATCYQGDEGWRVRCKGWTASREWTKYLVAVFHLVGSIKFTSCDNQRGVLSVEVSLRKDDGEIIMVAYGLDAKEAFHRAAERIWLK